MTFDMALAALKTVSNNCYISRKDNSLLKFRIRDNKFERKILRLCATKGEMTYYETKYIFEVDAIISEQYYNDWCMCRVRRSHVVKKGKS